MFFPDAEKKLALVKAQEEEVRAIVDAHLEREAALKTLLEELYREQQAGGRACITRRVVVVTPPPPPKEKYGGNRAPFSSAVAFLLEMNEFSGSAGFDRGKKFTLPPVHGIQWVYLIVFGLPRAER